jgi:hypothetical protein
MIIASLAYTILVQRGIKNALRVQSLEQSARVETELKMTAYFAHGLRNPLEAIDCALESMPDNLPEKSKELIVGMQLCTSRFVLSIMNNLLDTRKFEEEKLVNWYQVQSPFHSWWKACTKCYCRPSSRSWSF